MITRDTQIEDIVKVPGVVTYFIQQGVSPISCVGAFPQPLGKLLELKKVANPDAFITGLNAFLAEKGISIGEGTD